MAKRRPASIALAVKANMRGETADPSARPSVTADDAAILAEARARWDRCDEHEDAQRKSILEAKRFRAGDQWPEAIRIQRAGSSAIQGRAAVPPKPCLTIDRLSQPCRQVSNTIKNADFGFDVLPNGNGADDEVAELFEGYLRRVQIQSRGESPIEWAADGAIEGGIGWFRIRTEYTNETWDGDTKDPAAYDQELRLERIPNNLSVYCDPSAMRPTRSDAQFAFVTEDLAKDEFRSRYSKADFASLEDFASTGDNKGWVSEDSVRISEYWRIRYEETTIEHGRLKRIIRKPIVEGFKISATEILERWLWAGSRIPLIPIIGEELNIDGKVVVRGIIQEGMDAQRMVNYTYSGAVEIFALGGKSPYIVEENQIANYLPMWQNANTTNYAALIYKNVPGVEKPHRETTEAPIQAAVALMQSSEEGIKATTGIYDPALGNIDPRAHSGEAIKSLVVQSDASTANYANNVTRALTYAGTLMIEIIPKITRVGQLIHIVGDDDEPQQAIVGQPYSVQNGQATPSQGITPEQARLSQGLHKFYDLTQGTYAVTVTAGKATATKREEGAAALKELIPYLPPEMQMVITPDYVRQLSFIGSEKIATKLEKALPPALQTAEPGQDDPRLAQAMQQVQALQGQLQSKVAEKQAEVQAQGQIDLQKAQMDNDTKIKIVQIQQEGAFAVADLKATIEAANTAIAAMQAERLALEESSKENRTQAQEHAAEAARLAAGQAHEIKLSSLEHAQTLEQNTQQHKQTLEQTKQAADLAPEPAAPAGGAA